MHLMFQSPSPPFPASCNHCNTLPQLLLKLCSILYGSFHVRPWLSTLARRTGRRRLLAFSLTAARIATHPVTLTWQPGTAIERCSPIIDQCIDACCFPLDGIGVTVPSFFSFLIAAAPRNGLPGVRKGQTGLLVARLATHPMNNVRTCLLGRGSHRIYPSIYPQPLRQLQCCVLLASSCNITGHAITRTPQAQSTKPRI